MNVWIFDVDGVLSNLLTREISQPTLFSSLLTILTRGDLLTFNTGRGTAWVQRNILTHLETMLPDPSLLRNCFIVGEKGGTYQQYGQSEEIVSRLTVDPILREKIQTLVQQEFSDCAFFDEDKKTMISVEMRKDVSLEYYAQRQNELLPTLEKFFKESEQKDNYTIDTGLIATDIQHISAGKDLGVEHILTWVEEHKHAPDMFYCFGDSPTDLHMGVTLKEKNLHFSFVYVGEQPIAPTTFAPIIPEEKFDLGTARVLQELLTL